MISAIFDDFGGFWGILAYFGQIHSVWTLQRLTVNPQLNLTRPRQQMSLC